MVYMMFPDASKYVFSFCAALLAAYLLTPLAGWLARRIGMVDQPGERRIHTGIVPRGGGLAVFLAFHLGCAAVYFMPWGSFSIKLDQQWWHLYLPVSTFMLLVGLMDDRFSICPLMKLVCQILAGAMLYAGGIRFGTLFTISIPAYLDLPLTILWFVGFMNAFNLIDGLDGLAAGLGLIAAAGLTGALLLRSRPGDVLVMLCLMGACLGFLRFNFSPARIFLGDSGSMFIGLTLAATSLSTGSKGTVMASMGIPLLAAGIPILDTALAIWRRSLQHWNNRCQTQQGNGDVFGADADHLHHRLLRKAGITHRGVVLTLYALNGAFILAGLASILFASHALGIYLLAFVVGVYVVVRHLAHVELWQSGVAVLHGLRRPPSKAVAVMIYPLVDLLVLALALYGALHICIHGRDMNGHLFLRYMVHWGFIPFLALAAFGIYRRVWSRARTLDYARLFFAVTVAMPLALVLHTPEETLPHGLLSAAALFWALSAIGLAAVRLFPRILQESMGMIIRARSLDSVDTRNFLVYGTECRCALFLRLKMAEVLDEEHHSAIIGLLDDDSNLHNRYVEGCKVLGGIDQLDAILAQHDAHYIIVTCRLPPETTRKLLALAQKHSVAISSWNATLNPFPTPA